MGKKHDDGNPVLVTELGFSTRVTHLLQRNGIHSVAILERMGDESLMLLRGMGPGMFAEIRSKVPRPKKSDAENLAAYRATGLTPEEIMEVRFLIAASHDPEKLSHLRDLVLADENGRCVVLDEPRKPLVWGDDSHDFILCPSCGHDLMGGFPEADSCEVPMYQCPYCGQPIDGTNVLTREDAAEDDHA